MSEVKELALKIYKERQEKIKEIEERKRQEEENEKNRIKHYCTLILNLFDVSNIEEIDLMVNKVKVLNGGGEHLTCFVAFSKAAYYDTDFICVSDIKKNDEKAKKLKRLISAMEIINICESTFTIITDIEKYLNENAGAYFKVEENGSFEIDITICEKEEKEE